MNGGDTSWWGLAGRQPVVFPLTVLLGSVAGLTLIPKLLVCVESVIAKS